MAGQKRVVTEKKKNMRHDKGAERGWIMGGRVEDLFSTQKLVRYTCWKFKGGKKQR